MSRLHLTPPASLNQFCSKPHLVTHVPGLGTSPDLGNSTAMTQHLLSQGEPAKSTSKTIQVPTLHEGRSRDTNYSAFNETKPDPFIPTRGKAANQLAQPRSARNTEVGSLVSLGWLLEREVLCFPQKTSVLESPSVKPELP